MGNKIRDRFRRADGTFTSKAMKGVSIGFKFPKGNNYNPKGNPSSLVHKLGPEHPSWKGKQIIKRDGEYYSHNGERMPMSRWVWISAGRPYKKGNIIVHKDKDMWNNDLDNLACITRAQLIKWNRGTLKL